MSERRVNSGFVIAAGAFVLSMALNREWLPLAARSLGQALSTD